MARSLRESYELLGLPTNASEEEVKRAYKQKARECHPDKNPGDPKATERFQALQQGYERIVSGSSAAGEYEDDDEQFFGGFPSFFHFVMFQEMMRRRMEEQMMARMFGGIFFEDDSDDDDDIPFGFFGMPFFQRPRHYPHSSARSHRWHFRENSRYERSSYEPRAGGTSASKPPKKEKRKPRRPAETGGGNGNKPKTTEPQKENTQKHNKTFDDGNSKSNYREKDSPFNAERPAHGEERPEKQNTAPKSKQKSKNKSQMTSSEWQKGRKHKKGKGKRQNAKFSCSKDKTFYTNEPVFDSESETSDTVHNEFPPQTQHRDQKAQEHDHYDSDTNHVDEAQTCGKTTDYVRGDETKQTSSGHPGDKNIRTSDTASHENSESEE